eukprot:RCo051868
MAGYRAVWGVMSTTTGSRISRLILCSLFLAPTSFSPPRGSYCIVKLAASGALNSYIPPSENGPLSACKCSCSLSSHSPPPLLTYTYETSEVLSAPSSYSPSTVVVIILLL